MQNKLEQIKKLPDRINDAIREVWELKFDQAPPNVQKDLSNMLTCLAKTKQTTSRMVTALLQKPSVVAYLEDRPPPDQRPTLEERLAKLELQLTTPTAVTNANT
nr:MAG: protein B [Xinjiang mountain noda-like virus 1]